VDIGGVNISADESMVDIDADTALVSEVTDAAVCCPASV